MRTSSDSPDLITIVDSEDNVIGSEERAIVRQKGLICRIVRVIITNSQRKILIQQRSSSREDNPSKWDWSATGHVDADEEYLESALRETTEEIGLTGIRLTLIGKYYDENHKSDRSLRRFNAVYIGKSDQPPRHDPLEVAATRWITPTELKQWLASKPQDFTPAIAKIIDLYPLQVFGHR